MKNFDIFIREHYASICAVAERFVKSSDIAKDIAQEVIIKFWENPDRDKIASVGDFLFIMTRNTSLNYIRGKKREEKRYDFILSESDKEMEIFNMLVEEEYNQLLISAIDKLPKSNARIIRYALSGYNNKEIATLLGISINTVKSIKYSEIRKLRQYFDQVIG
ncbi:MAG: RNA polymerase sigma-70 factor [Bacteroidetes bacterium GWF2_40_14]|nr:MAG: RNA polymerase sigma-70 factor [Bacteroidetes bacterium GWF2_40_14]